MKRLSVMFLFCSVLLFSCGESEKYVFEPGSYIVEAKIEDCTYLFECVISEGRAVSAKIHYPDTLCGVYVEYSDGMAKIGYEEYGYTASGGAMDSIISFLFSKEKGNKIYSKDNKEYLREDNIYTAKDESAVFEVKKA